MDRRLLAWAVAASLLACAVVAVECYALHTPKYEASIKILVGQTSRSGGPYPIPNPLSGLQDLTPRVAKAVPTKPVAQGVVDRLNLPKGSAGKVLKNISAEQEPGTTFVDVSYKDSNQKRAQQIANAIGRVVPQRISETSLGDKRITATLWEPATYPQNPVSPQPVRNGLIALSAMLVLSAALIAWREISGR